MNIDAKVVLAIRATLARDGYADVQYEVRADDGFHFRLFENGREVGTYWKTPSPQQAISGSARPMTIQEAWEGSLARKFANYSVRNLEELVAET